MGPIVEETPQRGIVLVVEDEAYVRDSLGHLLRAQGYDPILTGGADEALATLRRNPVDLVLTDLRMPGISGPALIRRLVASAPDVPVVVLTGHGTIASAIECLRVGASDYLLKPAGPEALYVALERALATRALRTEVDRLRRARALTPDSEMPIGKSPAWTRVMDRVRVVAPTDSTVLLLGESGTGKELVARLIHRLGPCSGGPYVGVNCSAIPMEMWESEFFGHRKGAFAGAAADRDGRFRLAHRGTLFMDEIGAMPLPAQAKILRVLQDGTFDRLGDEQPSRVDVRIVAATNTDIEAEVAAARFRHDLFYRLDVVRIQLPPLRERPEDIPLLARAFAVQIAERLGRAAPEVAPEVLADLEAYPWPGNVRELRNVIERAMILYPGNTLATLDLAPAQGGVVATPPASGTGGGLNLRASLAWREREVVLEALRRSAGVRKEAAALLGIDQRNLGYYLRKHGLDPDQLPSRESEFPERD